MTNIGIDIGSTYTKYCVLSDDGVILRLWSERTPVRQKEYFADKLMNLRANYSACRVVSCGYGKRNIESLKSVTELSALSVGLDKVCPDIPVALDIGGQDTKIIRQKDGKLREFFVNDKCAAGSGLFFASVLNILDTRFEKVALDSAYGADEINLSNLCAVFAQSEIVELLAFGTEPAAIIQAAVRQILTQAFALLNKIDESGTLVLSGGLSQIRGFEPFAAKVLNRAVCIPENAPYLAALGCAVIAWKGQTL
ncbi:MAG: acyl-CoA dehydratase activase [Clostridium sp.]|jgi:predicted CoA-substrate-specific enzyme activase|nr:acyl-CoA dehydratase activase [Clostridium sp.]